VKIPGCEDLVSIGGGPRGAVYRGVQQPAGRPVAVRIYGRIGRGPVLPAALPVPPHPSLVDVLATGVTPGGLAYTVMEHLDGGDLATRSTRRPLGVLEAVTMAAGIADALRVLHGAGLSHGGVAPHNVLFDRAGRAKLGDARGMWSTTPVRSVREPAAAGVRPRIGGPPVRHSAATDGAAAVHDLAGLGQVLQTALRGAPDPSPAVAVVHREVAEFADLLATNPAAAGSAAFVARRLSEWEDALASASRRRRLRRRRRVIRVAGTAVVLAAAGAGAAVVLDLDSPSDSVLATDATGTTATSVSPLTSAVSEVTRRATTVLAPPSTTTAAVDTTDPSATTTTGPPETTTTGASPTTTAPVTTAASATATALPDLAEQRPRMFAWTGFRLVYTDPARDAVGFAPAGAADPAAAAEATLVGTGTDPGGLAVGFGSVWVTSARDGTVSRHDTVTLARQAVVTVGAGPVSVAVGHGLVWVVNMVDGTVSVVDPQTDVVVATVAVGREPFGIAATASAVWVTNTTDGTLSRIDPAGRTVTATIPVGAQPVGVAESDGSLWVANRADGTLARVDPDAGRVVTVVPVGVGVVGVAAGPVGTGGAGVTAVVAATPALDAYRMVLGGATPGLALAFADLAGVPLVAGGNIVFPTEPAGGGAWSFGIVDLT
jgi:YVTN family beta-propeller protein